MRELTLNERISKYEMDFLEKEMSVNIPVNFKLFMQRYGGLSVKENQYDWTWKGKEMILYLNEFLSFTEMFNLSKKIEKEQGIKMIPFANDPNGMYFFLSCQEEELFVINILSIDLSNQYLQVSNNFENFISNLQSEQDVV